MKAPLFLVLAALLFGFSASGFSASPAVLPGIDSLIKDHSEILAGRRLGLITNRTGNSASGRSTIDLLAEHSDSNLVALFSPEHGIRGEVEAGQSVSDSVDKRTQTPIFSLYGKTRRPTPEMLKGIDLLVYDIQDIGVRSYTYISTMGYAMEAAAEAGLPFVVLDRPDPLGGNLVDGPVLSSGLVSFVGPYEMPWVYGMTPGEVARWIKQKKLPQLDLKVVPVSGWTRGMTYEQTRLRWIPPSPNVLQSRTSLFYAITGALGELGTFSEGVGTEFPFELVGAPWMDAEELAQRLNAADLSGVHFSPIHFTPIKYAFSGKSCHGVRIHVDDPAKVRPSAVMVHIAKAVQDLYGSNDPFRPTASKIAMFDQVLGFAPFRQWLHEERPADEFLAEWQRQVQEFIPSRSLALIYK